jgi:hypothetical protein
LNATNISQSFESSNSVQFSGKSVTFSFYARAGANYSAASSALTVTVRSGTGADQNIATGFTGSTNVFASSATLTTTWQRFTFTGTVAASATQLGWILGFTPVGTAGAADYFEVTGIQMEAGSVATPFETEDYGTTLAKCQRYYARFQTGSADYHAFTTGQVNSTAQGGFFIRFPLIMRSAPTAIETTGTASNYYINNSGGNAQTVTVLPSFQRANVFGAYFLSSIASGLVAGDATEFGQNNVANVFLAFSAEL